MSTQEFIAASQRRMTRAELGRVSRHGAAFVFAVLIAAWSTFIAALWIFDRIGG